MKRLNPILSTLRQINDIFDFVELRFATVLRFAPIKNRPSKIINCLCLLLLFTGCDREDAWDVFKTRGEHVMEQRTLPAFHAITVRNGINVTLRQGENYSAAIEGWKNLMPKIRLSVDEDGNLLIDDANSFNFVRSRDNMTTVHLMFAGELNYIHFSGNGYIVSADTISTSGLTLLCEKSSGSVDLKVKAQGVNIGTSGNLASIIIGGWCNNAGLTNWGFAPVDLSALKASSADIYQRSPGNVYVNASESLSVTIYSIGDVYYSGNPSITLVRNGKGNLHRMSD